MEDKTVLTVAAMACITALEVINLIKSGPDGTILAGVVAALAGLAGYSIKSIFGKK